MALPPFLIFFVLAAVVILLLIFVKRTGNTGKRPRAKRANALLRRHAWLRRQAVLENVWFSDGQRTACFESLLVGRFGCLAVTTLYGNGGFYGEPDSEHWLFRQNDSAESAGRKIPNALKEQNKAVALLRALLAKHKIYKVSIRQAICLPGKRAVSGLTAPKGVVLGKKPFKKLLLQEHFSEDAGVDPAKIIEMLEQRRVEAPALPDA